MLQKNETLAPTESPLGNGFSPEVESGPAERPTRWPWIVGAALVVVLVAAVATWWVLDSTVSQDLYDETVAELEASEEALAASEEALTAARDEATELRSEVDALQQQTDELESALSVETERVTELEALSEELQRQLDGAGTPASDQVKDSITNATEALSAARSARYVMTTTIDGTEIMTMDSAYDGDAGLFAITMTVDPAIADGDAPDQMAMILDQQAGLMYMNAEALDLPTDASWVSIDVAAMVAPLGISPEDFQSEASEPFLSVTPLLDSATEVRDLGIEEIDGVTARHVRITLDTDEFLTANPDLLETVEAEGAASDLPAEIPFDLWITDAGQLHRQSVSLEVDDLEMVVQLDFLSIGGPIDIETPAPQDVIDMADIELG